MKKILPVVIVIIVGLAALAPFLRGTPRLLHGSNVTEPAATSTEDLYRETAPLVNALMGDLYHNGAGVPQDTVKATTYYTNAAQMGHSRAQSALDAIQKGEKPSTAVTDSSEDSRRLGEIYDAFSSASKAKGADIVKTLNDFGDVIAPTFESTRESMVFERHVFSKALDTIEEPAASPPAAAE